VKWLHGIALAIALALGSCGINDGASSAHRVRAGAPSEDKRVAFARAGQERQSRKPVTHRTRRFSGHTL
jgi:hypothetical protein